MRTIAKKGSNKRRSQDQEKAVADRYGGTVSPSSGAADTDAGDVRTDTQIIECKTTGGPEKPARSKLVRQLEKVAKEAWAEGCDPALALRFYMPDSQLADPRGWVDLIVRRMSDDLG